MRLTLSGQTHFTALPRILLTMIVFFLYECYVKPLYIIFGGRGTSVVTRIVATRRHMLLELSTRQSKTESMLLATRFIPAMNLSYKGGSKRESLQEVRRVKSSY